MATLAGFAAPSSATVIFQYSSTCLVNCGAVGLPTGGAVNGAIGISDAAVIAGAVNSVAQLTSLDLHFGNLTFGLASLGSVSITLNPQRTAATMFTLITNALPSAPGYAFSQASWSAGPSQTNFAVGGTGALVVPEPASVALLATGLLALGTLRRRARSQR